MDPPTARIFVSYSHFDEGHLGGLVRAIVDGISKEITLLTTADPPPTFFDLENMGWGDAWGDRINAAISDSDIFIPFYSPQYFASANCRNEFRFFHDKANELGYRDQLLGVLLVDVDDFGVDSRDPLIAVAATHHYKDVTELRFNEIGSVPFVRAIHDMAVDIIRVLAAQPDVVETVSTSGDGDVEPTPPMDPDQATETSMAQTLRAVVDSFDRVVETVNDQMNRFSQRNRSGMRRTTPGGAAEYAESCRVLLAEMDGPHEELARTQRELDAVMSQIVSNLTKSDHGNACVSDLSGTAVIIPTVHRLRATAVVVDNLASSTRFLRAKMRNLSHSLQAASYDLERLDHLVVEMGQRTIVLGSENAVHQQKEGRE